MNILIIRNLTTDPCREGSHVKLTDLLGLRPARDIFSKGRAGLLPDLACKLGADWVGETLQQNLVGWEMRWSHGIGLFFLLSSCLLPEK